MEERKNIKRILSKATLNLCENLDLSSSNVIPVLKSKEVLSDGDVADIQSSPRPADKVDRMLVLLKRKPAVKYYRFIEALKEVGRDDLYEEMKVLEAECGLHVFVQAVTLPREVKAAQPEHEASLEYSRTVEPDESGSYESVHVRSAPKPTSYQLNANKCYISLLSTRKGLAYILNVKNFSSPLYKLRKGSPVDFQNMKHLFKELGYRIIEHVDLSAEEINQTIDDFVSLFTYEDASSVVVLMSHGRDGFIVGEDGRKVMLNTIVERFKPRNCPFLGGKPKLFFVQACRGDRSEGSESPPAEECEADLEIDGPGDPNVSENADIFTAYATTEGYKSIRDTAAGSWFVQAIVEAFVASAHEESLHQLMNQVTNRVSTKDGKFFDQETKTHKRAKQTPQIKHSLRKDVYFHPKLEES